MKAKRPRPKKYDLDSQLSFRMGDELKIRLFAIAEAEELKAADIARRAVKEYVERYEAQKKSKEDGGRGSNAA